MSRGEADLVASIRHELAAIRPPRTCCIQVELAALGDSGRRVDIAVARAVHELGTELSQRGAARPWSGSPREQAEHATAHAARTSSPRHCRRALLRGRLLARGSLSLASGSVHLEINLAPGEAAALAELARREGLGGRLRERRGKGLLVWKSRQELIDLFRHLGASASVAEVEARGVGRELRGTLNRSINAETANLRRTVAAGVRQARACRYAIDLALLPTGSLESRVAHARASAPEAPLSELADALELPRSKVQRLLAQVEHRVRAEVVSEHPMGQPLR